MLVFNCNSSPPQSATPLTPAQRVAFHEKNALCALVFAIFCVILAFACRDVISGMALFFPISAASLIYGAAEAKIAHHIHRNL